VRNQDLCRTARCVRRRDEICCLESSYSLAISSSYTRVGSSHKTAVRDIEATARAVLSPKQLSALALTSNRAVGLWNGNGYMLVGQDLNWFIDRAITRSWRGRPRRRQVHALALPACCLERQLGATTAKPQLQVMIEQHLQ
jgi:hypothetical protein